MILMSPDGTRYDTKDVPRQYDPFFCAKCGQRIGWILDDGGIDMVRTICEDCIAAMANEA